MRRLLTLSWAGAFMAVLCTAPVQATLTNSFQFNGNGNWSIDGHWCSSNPVGNLDAIVPVGSTVVQAFLYSTTFGPIAGPDGGF